MAFARTTTTSTPTTELSTDPVPPDRAVPPTTTAVIVVKRRPCPINACPWPNCAADIAGQPVEGARNHECRHSRSFDRHSGLTRSRLIPTKGIEPPSDSRSLLDEQCDENRRGRDPDTKRQSEKPCQRHGTKHLVQDTDGIPLQERGRYPDAGKSDAERGHEGGRSEPDMCRSVEPAKEGTQQDGSGNRPESEFQRGRVVGDEHGHEYSAQRENTLDGQIDTAHQDDERRPHGQHDRNCRGIQQPGQIPGIEEFRVEDRYEQAENDQHRDRRKRTMPTECRNESGGASHPHPSRQTSDVVKRSASAATPRPRKDSPQPR